MEKIKPLLSSLREKKRYLTFEILEKKPIDIKIAKINILDNFIRLYGEFGAANAGLIFMEELYHKNKGIIRVSNKSLDKLRGSLTTIKDIHVKSIGASGILKKAQEFMINK